MDGKEGFIPTILRMALISIRGDKILTFFSSLKILSRGTFILWRYAIKSKTGGSFCLYLPHPTTHSDILTSGATWTVLLGSSFSQEDYGSREKALQLESIFVITNEPKNFINPDIPASISFSFLLFAPLLG